MYYWSLISNYIYITIMTRKLWFMGVFFMGGWGWGANNTGVYECVHEWVIIAKRVVNEGHVTMLKSVLLNMTLTQLQLIWASPRWGFDVTCYSEIVCCTNSWETNNTQVSDVTPNYIQLFSGTSLSPNVYIL